MSRLPPRLLLAAVFVFLAAAPAHAEVINWRYNWHRSPVSIAADDPGTGGVSLTNQVNEQAANSSDVVSTNLRVFSSAPDNTPDKFDKNGAYTLTLNLKDDKSGLIGSLTFTGKLSGTFSANSSNISNAFTGATTQSLILGTHTYTVTIGPFAPPGPPSSSNAGSISAYVAVSDSVGVRDVPEPASLTLCGLGMGIVAFAAWRKRRVRLTTASGQAGQG